MMDSVDQSLDFPIEPTVRTTIFGKIRTHADLSKWERAFLIISSLTLIITVTLTIVTISSVTDKVDRTLGIILLVHTLICAFYVFDGVFRERPYEIVIYVVSVCVVLCYILFNFFTNLSSSIVNTVKLARLVCSVVFVPPNVALGVYIAMVYTKTGNLIFRTVGAQIILQSACRILFLFEGLLKFDFHMSVLLLLLIDFDVLSTLEIILLAVGVPLVIFWLIVGFVAAVYELRFLMYAFWATCFLQPAYVALQLFIAVTELQTPSTSPYTYGPIISTAAGLSSNSTSIATSTTPPGSVSMSFVTFVLCAISIVVRVWLIMSSVFVYRNFGKGLMQRIKFGWKAVIEERDSLIDAERREREKLMKKSLAARAYGGVL